MRAWLLIRFPILIYVEQSQCFDSGAFSNCRFRFKCALCILFPTPLPWLQPPTTQQYRFLLQGEEHIRTETAFFRTALDATVTVWYLPICSTTYLCIMHQMLASAGHQESKGTLPDLVDPFPCFLFSPSL